jgi:hypothetical protein
MSWDFIDMGASLELLEQFSVCGNLRGQVKQKIWAKSNGWARKLAILSILPHLASGLGITAGHPLFC